MFRTPTSSCLTTMGSPLAQESKKWKLAVVDQVKAPIDKVWELTSDFVRLDRWLPHLSSTLVAGEAQKPGAVRHVVGTGPGPLRGSFVVEELVAMDAENHTYSYTVLDGKMKLEDYLAVWKLAEGTEPGSTTVSLSYEMAPCAEVSEQQFASFIGKVFQNSIDHLKTMVGGSSESLVVSEAKAGCSPQAVCEC